MQINMAKRELRLISGKWRIWAAALLVMLCVMAGMGCSREEAVTFRQSQPAYNKQEKEGSSIVTIGNLTLTLPQGWWIKVRQEGELTQYVLEDLRSSSSYHEVEVYEVGYKHEIVITPYEISQMPEDALQLAAAMKEYFQVPVLYGIKGTGKTEEIWGCWMVGEDRSREEKEYFLFSQKGLQGEDSEARELFHVRESSIYAYQNEVEVFGDFLDKGLVQIDGALATDRSRPGNGGRNIIIALTGRGRSHCLL